MEKNIGSCKNQRVCVIRECNIHESHAIAHKRNQRNSRRNLQGSRDAVRDKALQAGEGLTRNLERIDDSAAGDGSHIFMNQVDNIMI